MPTHQSLGGASDEQLLQRMVATHSERYGQDYWAAFDAGVAPRLPASPVVIDLGCGPGLFLRDFAQRDPSTRLYGYDVTPAMIAHGRQLPPTGANTALAVHDVATQPLPLTSGTDGPQRPSSRAYATRAPCSTTAPSSAGEATSAGSSAWGTRTTAAPRPARWATTCAPSTSARAVS